MSLRPLIKPPKLHVLLFWLLFFLSFVVPVLILIKRAGH